MKFFRLIPFLAAAFFAVSAHAEIVDGVVAVINDAVITRQQVQEFAFAGTSIDALRSTAPDQATFDQKLNSLLTNSLELLIERQLILHAFDSQGYRMPDSYLDELVQDRIRDKFGDRVTLTKTLQAQGETFAQFRDDMRDQTIEQFMRSKNVSQEIIISPFQVENYYVAHRDDYKVEDEVKLRMIVLNKSSADDTNTTALAQEIVSKIKDGAKFADMASVYSQGSQQKEGGEWGWIERSKLRKELAAAAEPLKVGDTSDVIDTPDACYIMLVEDKHAARTKSISEVRDEIEKTLRAQEEARLEKQWIESLKKKTFIRIFA